MPSAELATIRRNPARHRFEAELDGQVAGFITYRERDGVLELVHTEVDERFEGRGVGGQLAREALEDARRQGQKVLPSCSFVAGWLRRHPEYNDTVAAR